MSGQSPLQKIESLLEIADRLSALTKKAAQHGKSLSGDNFYGKSFHENSILLAVAAKKVKTFSKNLECDQDEVELLISCLDVVSDTSTNHIDRLEGLKEIQRICKTVLLPYIESLAADPEPTTEQVLPLAVVAKTRPYIENVVKQANGCFEHEWFDACSVMIRRLVETLIIEVYEHQGRTDEIKDIPGPKGNFFMLNKLVDTILNDIKFSLGRETKRGLPLLKSLGDRAAHNRHFVAKKSDIEKVVPDLRVVASELLSLAGLK